MSDVLKIKITGSGTLENIKQAITSLDNPDNDFDKGEQFEDATLYTEINIETEKQ